RDVDGRDRVRAAEQVVDGEDDVREEEECLGQAEVVRRARGQAFEVADDVIADVADGAAEEARQPGRGGRPAREQQALEVAQRVRDGLGLAPAVLRRPAAHAAAGREPPRLAGPRAEERVARPGLAADDGLEEESEARAVPAPLALARRACELPVGGDRGVRVEEELAPDGHEVGAGGEPGEVVESGMEHGNKCRNTGPTCQTPTQPPTPPSPGPPAPAARPPPSSAGAAPRPPAARGRPRRQPRRGRSPRGYGGCGVATPSPRPPPERRVWVGEPPPPRPSARETALPCLPARVGELRGELRAGTFAVRPWFAATNLRPPPPGRGRGRSPALAHAHALARSS